MAAQVQLANTFNDFREAYNNAANDITTLQGLQSGTQPANVTTLTVNSFTNTKRIPFVSTANGLLAVDSGLQYDSGTLQLTVGGQLSSAAIVSTANGNFAGSLTSANVTANNLTSGRVVFAGASGLLSDDAELRYVTANNGLIAANVVIDNRLALSSLTSGRILIARVDGEIGDDSGLTYNSGTDSLSASGNITATAWSNAANMNITNNVQVGANVNVTDTVNALSHLHVGGVETWIANKQEDRDIHLIAAVDDSDGPHDIAIVNRNNNANAYGEFIAMNNAGNTSQGWVSMGINATNYNQGAFSITKGDDAYILYEAPVGTTKSGDLVIGTGGNGTGNKIIFSANGFDDPANNTQLTIIPGQRVHVEVPTQSTSTTTGALTVAGGVGIVGNMNVGGNVAITGTITLTGSGNTVSTDTLAVANAILFLANGNSTDSLDIGYVGQYNNTYFGVVRDRANNRINIFQDLATRPANTTNFGAVNYANTRAGVLHASNTAAPTNPSTGALIVTGGAGIGGGIWAGGAIRTDSTTASTSTTTGALIINGGAGIAGNTNIGGILKTTDSTASTSTSTGALIVGGGAGIAGATYIGGILDVAKSTQQTDVDNSAQVAVIKNTSTDTAGNLTGIRYRQENGTNAGNGFVGLSSTGDGSTRARLVLASPNASGNAVERISINSSGNTIITSTTASTSTTTGALIVAGGAAVQGNTYVGGDLSVSGSIIANEVVEGVTDVAVSTNTYNVDYNNGNIFYATTAPASGDFTLALTNVPTTNGRITTISLILPQGATARRPSSNAISINGTSTLVNWVGGNTAITPTASKTDIFNFTILRRSNAFTVSGTLTANTVL